MNSVVNPGDVFFFIKFNSFVERNDSNDVYSVFHLYDEMLKSQVDLSFAENCEDFMIQPLSLKLSKHGILRIHGLTLPKFGYKTQTPAEVGGFKQWFEWLGDVECLGDLGFSISVVMLGELKRWYLWMYIYPCFILELAPESCR